MRLKSSRWSSGYLYSSAPSYSSASAKLFKFDLLTWLHALSSSGPIVAGRVICVKMSYSYSGLMLIDEAQAQVPTGPKYVGQEKQVWRLLQ